MTALPNIKHLAVMAWALVNAGLVVAIGNVIEWGDTLHLPVPAPAVQPPASVDLSLPPDYRLPDREKNYAATLARPLFVASRREAPPVPPPPPPAMKKGQFQLLGTTITDELRTAMVREVANDKIRHVGLNQVINGLRVERIEADWIVLGQYDDREEVRLKIQPSPVVVPPAQAAGAAAVGNAAQRATAASSRARVLPRSRAVPGADSVPVPANAPAPANVPGAAGAIPGKPPGGAKDVVGP